VARYSLSDAKDEHSIQFVSFADAMEAMTGQRDVLATPLLNYFEPLRVWLEAKNAENNEFIGWESPAKEDNLDPEAAAALAPIIHEAIESFRKLRVN
jgi:hypothetical protein